MEVNFEAQKASKEKQLTKGRRALEERVRRLVSSRLLMLSKNEPRLVGFTVTRVAMTKDFKKADVYVQAGLVPAVGVQNAAAAAGAADSLAALKGYEKKIRSFVSQNLEAKSCPQINFLLEADLSVGFANSMADVQSSAVIDRFFGVGRDASAASVVSLENNGLSGGSANGSAGSSFADKFPKLSISEEDL